MFLRFFPQETIRSLAFADTLQGAPLYMAEVQGFFLFFKDDPEGCLREAHKLAKDAKIAQLHKAAEASQSTSA